MTFVTILVLVIVVLMAAGFAFASYNRDVKAPSPSVQTQQAEARYYLYPDRNGRYVQAARQVGTRGGDKKVLHVGHPNNAPFSRPFNQLRRATFQAA